MPDINLPDFHLPKFGGKGKVKGGADIDADADVSVPSIDADLPDVEADIDGNVNLPSGEVEVKGPSVDVDLPDEKAEGRSEEHTSELQSRPHISYAVFCLKKKKKKIQKKSSPKNLNRQGS